MWNNFLINFTLFRFVQNLVNILIAAVNAFSEQSDWCKTGCRWMMTMCIVGNELRAIANDFRVTANCKCNMTPFTRHFAHKRPYIYVSIFAVGGYSSENRNSFWIIKSLCTENNEVFLRKFECNWVSDVNFRIIKLLCTENREVFLRRFECNLVSGVLTPRFRLYEDRLCCDRRRSLSESQVCSLLL